MNYENDLKKKKKTCRKKETNEKRKKKGMHRGIRQYQQTPTENGIVCPPTSRAAKSASQSPAPSRSGSLISLHTRKLVCNHNNHNHHHPHDQSSTARRSVSDAAASTSLIPATSLSASSSNQATT